MKPTKNTYGQTLRSSSIAGGAQGLNYIIGLIRVKLVAVLIGPSGVGLIGLYTSAIGLVGVVSALGVGTSAVREIVRANSRDDPEEVARTVIVLRRVCWATGLAGWALTILFCVPLSKLMTGTSGHAKAIALLGSILLLREIRTGQLALLQGLRRIGDLARAEVLGAFVGSIVAVLVYFALRADGIVPGMMATTLIGLTASWWFARRIKVKPLAVSLKQTLSGFRQLVGLGMAFMWGGVVGAALDMFTRTLITRKFGIEAAGVYQAAWALSSVFASFVLSAMAADFYPRLTAAIHDRKQATLIVNEQTEIGVLLALPGLLGALAFAPLVIKLLYTSQFMPAADLLPWMALGVFGQVVSWPLGFVQAASGAARWFVATETIFSSVWALLVYVMVQYSGIVGAGYAFAAVYALYIPGMLWIARRMIDFSWSWETRKLLFIAAIFIIVEFGTLYLPNRKISVAAGACLTLASAVFCLGGLARRLDQDHSLVKFIIVMPFGRYMIKWWKI